MKLLLDIIDDYNRKSARKHKPQDASQEQSPTDTKEENLTTEIKPNQEDIDIQSNIIETQSIKIQIDNNNPTLQKANRVSVSDFHFSKEEFICKEGVKSMHLTKIHKQEETTKHKAHITTEVFKVQQEEAVEEKA